MNNFPRPLKIVGLDATNSGQVRQILTNAGIDCWGWPGSIGPVIVHEYPNNIINWGYGENYLDQVIEAREGPWTDYPRITATKFIQE